MENLNELRARLLSLQIPLTIVARDSGITYSWLMKFKHGEINNPTVRRVEQLQRYLAAPKQAA
jgi:transcriptional regulator with XRE-family HTH domain